ncbi:Plant cadmium resistance-like protein [Lachnellula suecica]|uniref:Plant cadmium resistance-like protein n=1 Tax=Lachnellula suecica TaxID=602035 RepID=A0A8T9C0K4_9HELO|nr:Plant cadmium resistance-like protein [Lachnellula suecica]
MKGCFCPCVVVGRNHHRIARGTDAGYDTCNGWCMGWTALACFGGCGWILQMIDRGDMRDKYDLEGSGCGACCTSFWCGCCEAIQTSKQLDYEQVSQNPGVPAGYVAQDKMNAMPQHH